ncbi:nucleotidyltransferase family protein [Methylobacterium oxalidis]|uniref:Polymerase nucleotidyl transferase domain-containing protein n=1 Tax=Methylobacterium oxalidis TaxID=944322 RepID=A0A512J155_9HYPH|nr:nucleotidyltransferase domain-containing protein [Methylobacterium oxalidis]GEP03665.1 hypothetical protein MOX02_17030 [Methylobacterium oxalidis]GJE34371.1 hypothetical protein LDDCCGHA_4582 [Methylobacterium oxalidis]GLS64992.1 hypothetical protein GCM10007888_33730 [Methylobacterium oxalidis]
MYRTLARRKADAAESRQAAVVALSARLHAFARERGGRFLLYGSAARGTMRHDSDVDLLLDFPPEVEADAWRFAEDLCTASGIESDILPLAWCTPAFAERILPQAMVLG